METHKIRESLAHDERATFEGLRRNHFLAGMNLYRPLVRDRGFLKSDTPNSLPVPMIDEEFARRYLANEGPVGRRIHLGPPGGILGGTPQNNAIDSAEVTIVGVRVITTSDYCSISAPLAEGLGQAIKE